MAKSILIAGYYRSGTSALSGALDRAGVDIFNSAERNTHNPRGYYENPAMIKLDIEAFEKLGRPWHDIRLMPAHWIDRPDVKAVGQRMVEQLVSHYSESTLWAAKHPHICRLLPLYRDAAYRITGEQPAVVRMFRDPWGVADSQRKKNGLSRAHALLLWASHVLEAEQASRDLPRTLVSYETLIKDPAAVLRNIQDDTDVVLPPRTADDMREISQFVTPKLRRSSTKGRGDTPAVLRDLVESIWDASMDEAQPHVFEHCRQRFIECCQLVDELATSKLPPTSALEASAKNTQAESVSRQVTMGTDMRPAERLDPAERARLLARIEERDDVPSYTVLIAVPEGRVEQAYTSAESINAQWFSPEGIQFVCGDSNCPDEPDWINCDAEPCAVSREIAHQISQANSDYIAVVDAGDTIEVDAAARLALTAALCDQPSLLYTDEIVANPRNPWIRYKPGFDIYRLRGLAYLTSWFWMRRTAVQDIGGLDADLYGAEEYDLALRVYDAGGRIVHVPEALYARYPDSLRDHMDVETLRTNCQASLGTHLERNALDTRVAVQPEQLPGHFALTHIPSETSTITLVLMCDDASSAQLEEMTAQSLQSLLQGVAIERVICAGTAANDNGANILESLADNTDGAGIQVVLEESESALVASVKERAVGQTTVFLSLDAESSDPNWLSHLQGRIDNESSVGIVGFAGDYPSDKGTRRLIGPLVFPAEQSLGVVGLGRLAEDHGPGGWLMTAQAVDGVIPPCIAIRNDVLADIEPHDGYSGAAVWLDIARQCEVRLGYAVIWDPSVRMHCAQMPSYLGQLSSITQAQASSLRRDWGQDSQNLHHHPHLSLTGDVLAPAGQPGLQRPNPAVEPFSLASGSPDDAGFVAECLKSARATGEFIAGWAHEPIAPAELRRLDPACWLRVNPEQRIAASDMPDYRLIYTRPPSDIADLQGLGKQAHLAYATSPILAEAIRKRARNAIHPIVLQPRIPERIWGDLPTPERASSNRIRVMWVDEGHPPPWIAELLSMEDIDWYVIESGTRQYNGPVATAKAPDSEEGWCALFQDVAPHVLIRPAQDETWMDCRMLLRGAAVGAMLLADERFDRPADLPVTTINPRFDDWRKVLQRLRDNPEQAIQASQQTRQAIKRVGWLEDDPACLELLSSACEKTNARRSA